MRSFRIKEQKWIHCQLKADDSDLPRVELSFSFDVKHFKIKAVVHDLHFRDGERSWRYGDGFLINFITDIHGDNQKTQKFYAYGFSVVAGKSLTTLVNHNGTYYLAKQEHQPDIQIDLSNQCAYYTIDLPWNMLGTFHPLLHKTLGINVVYTSRCDDGSRKILQLIEDEYFDSESKVRKKYVPVQFAPSEKSQLQWAVELDSTLVRSEQILMKTVIYSPANSETEISMTMHDPEGHVASQIAKRIDLKAGCNQFQEAFAAPARTGRYFFRATLNNILAQELDLYRLGCDELFNWEKRVESFRISAHSPLELSSYYGLKYKLRELIEQVNAFESGDSPTVIRQSVDDFQSLLNRCDAHHHLYTKGGYVRTAFLSPADQTLQPYSIYLPKNFNAERRYHLIIALHGSGVDEVDFLKSTGAKLAGSNYIIAAPRGRDLSDWYIGQTQNDVLDMIEALKAMFYIGKTLIYGFSMGGFGVWGLVSRAPKLFSGVIIRSGAIRNPLDDGNLLQNVRSSRDCTKEIPYLVMHGTEDQAVPFSAVEEFVQVLQEQGFQIEFQVIEGAGHSNYDGSDVIKNWLVRYRL